MRLRLRAAAARCAYCHAGLLAGAAGHPCRRCRTTLHRECWREAAGCPTLGCAGCGPIDCPGPAALRFRRLASLPRTWLEPDQAASWLQAVSLQPWLLLGLVGAAACVELLLLSTFVVGAGLVLQLVGPRPATAWSLVPFGAALGLGGRLLIVVLG